MDFIFVSLPSIALAVLLTPAGSAISAVQAQSTSSSATHGRKTAPVADSRLDAGSITNSLYRNPTLGFTCKIPPGWVLRTDEMNARDDDQPPLEAGKSGRVLLAAFSRPPAARGEDVNSSILIVAENADAYPGLHEPAQYFGPLTEIAKAQGFDVASEPYEFEVGAKTLVRGDFQKSIGTRLMHQSTLVILSRAYAISFTFIAGTDDELDDLIQGLHFGAPPKPH
jgi:hypothetical protein